MTTTVHKLFRAKADASFAELQDARATLVENAEGAPVFNVELSTVGGETLDVWLSVAPQGVLFVAGRLPIPFRNTGDLEHAVDLGFELLRDVLAIHV